MSGGSWNYLSCKPPEDVLGDLATMEAMRDRLRELGIQGKVIEDMGFLIGQLREAHRLGDTPFMRQVWHEVEWKDSGDHSIHQLRQAAWRYNGSSSCGHEKRTEPQVTHMWLEDEQRGSRARHQYCERCGANLVLEKDVER